MRVVAHRVSKRRWDVSFGNHAYVLTSTRTPHSHRKLWHVWKDGKPFGSVSKSFGAAYEQAQTDAWLGSRGEVSWDH